MQLRPRCSHRLLHLLGATLLTGIAGCGEQAQVVRYQAPKDPAENSAAGSKPVSDAAQRPESPDRMLAAIVPQGDNAWFFKLTGPADAVGGQVEAFDELVKSVTFPEAAAGKPEWTLPAGWRQKDGSSPMRYATLTIDAAQPALEVSVTTLPWQAANQAEGVLANINRWRAQMKQPPLAAADLDRETRSIKLKDGQAILADFRGAFSAGPMASGAAASAPAAQSQSTAKAAPQAAPSTAPAAEAETPARRLPLTFDVPAGWESSLPPTFAIAAFTAQHDSGSVEITITPLASAGGGLLPNVNRWRTQLKLPAITADELGTVSKPYKVDDLDADLVRLVGPEQSTLRSSIVAAVVERDGTSWFFRMRGAAAAADAEMENFETFVSSVKFRAGEN